MKKIKNMTLIRIVVQILCFALLPGLFINVYTGIKNIFTGIIHQTSSLISLLPDILLVASVVPFTIILGRIFCGWICSFGSLQDLLYALSKKLKKKSYRLSEKFDFWLKGVKYIILGGSVIFIWTLQIVAVPKGYNPWDVFGMVFSLGGWKSLNLVVTDFLPATILLIALIVGSFFIERLFCRYICPLGGFFAVVSRLRPLNIRKESTKCGSCSLCTSRCSMGIPMYSKDVIHSGECINCFKCTEACPKSNAHLEFAKIDVSPTVAGTVATAAMVGFFYLGNLSSGELQASTTTSVQQSKEKASDSSTSGTGSSSITGVKDGVYKGTGTGFRGNTEVEVKVSGGKITDVQLISSNDDEEFLDRAVQTVTSEILSKQSVDVDAVSGATYSSNGIMEAVANALNVKYESQPITHREEGHGPKGHRPQH